MVPYFFQPSTTDAAMRKLNHKFVLLFIVLMLIAATLIGTLSFRVTEEAVIDNAVGAMRQELMQKASAIAGFHEENEKDLLMAMEFPFFREYFELPESRAGNRYDAQGVIQFTEAQLALKKRIDQWVMDLQKRYTVLETCVIDHTGQEHSRITFGEIAPNADFSSEENGAPFFAPTMALDQGKVHLQYPYMSPDAGEWVFSYTSPIVLADGSKPAFFHYEIPLSLFQQQIAWEAPSGTGKGLGSRFFIVDGQGLIIADSAHAIDTKSKPMPGGEEAEHTLADYLPRAESFSRAPAFLAAVGRMQAGSGGDHVRFEADGVDYFLVFHRLPTFDWTIGFVQPYDALLQGQTSLTGIKLKIAGLSLAALVVAALIVWLVSSRITRPLVELTAATRAIAGGQLNAPFPADPPRDEIGVLHRAMQGMAGQLRHTVRGIILQSHAVAACASEIDTVQGQLGESAGETQKIIRSVAGDNQELGGELDQITHAVKEASESIEKVFREIENLTSQVDTISRGASDTSLHVSTMASAAEEMSANITGVHKSLEGVSGAVHKVAAAIDQISQSIDLVRQQCQSASQLTGEAKVQGEQTGRVIQKLSESAREIGKVVELISSIAEQTNMLALNAAIEAAGAGDAGKGFAVVAGEVKDLARQTAQATDLIGERVEEIQQNTRDAIHSTEVIVQRVHQVDEANQAIFHSVDEQGRAIREISRSVGEVVRSSEQVTRNANEMSAAASEVARSAAEAAGSAGQIARSSVQVSDFARNVAASSAHAQKFVISILHAAKRTRQASGADKVASATHLLAAINSTAHYLNRLSSVMGDASQSLVQAQAGLDAGPAPFDARTLKEAHLRWLGRLEGIVHMGAESVTEEVTSAHACLLGRWYDDEGRARFADHPLFVELGEVHEAVHRQAREAVDMVRQGQQAEAKDHLDRFDGLRRRLFELLDQLYVESGEEKGGVKHA